MDLKAAAPSASWLLLKLTHPSVHLKPPLPRTPHSASCLQEPVRVSSLVHSTLTPAPLLHAALGKGFCMIHVLPLQGFLMVDTTLYPF